MSERMTRGMMTTHWVVKPIISRDALKALRAPGALKAPLEAQP